VSSGLEGPYEIALDAVAGKMYWTDFGTDEIRNTIERANLDGSGREVLVSSGLGMSYGLALDIVAGKMYWTDRDTETIERANLDGSGREVLVSSRLELPYGIALDLRLFGTDTNVEDGEIPNMFGIDAVYPNPTMGSIKVEVTVPRSVGATISIHNVFGEMILYKRLNLSHGTSHVEIDLTDVASGVYFVSVSSEIGTTTHSILKY